MKILPINLNPISKAYNSTTFPLSVWYYMDNKIYKTKTWENDAQTTKEIFGELFKSNESLQM